MTKVNKKKLFLSILLVLLGFLITQRYTSCEGPQRVPLKYVKGKTYTGGVEEPNKDPNILVQLELLKERQKAEWTSSKNIFVPIEAFLPPPPPPPPIPEPPPLPPPPPPPPPGPTAEELAAQRARQEMSQFRYLGYLSREGREQVFLSKGKTLFIAKKGEVVTGQFFLKDLGANQVVIKDQQTDVEVTITLAKK